MTGDLKSTFSRVSISKFVATVDLSSACHPKLIVAALILGYALYFAAYKLSQHAAFQTYGYDFTYFIQALWNTLHGGFLRVSPRPLVETEYSFLQYHFSPGILLLVPLYALWPTPETLLILQAVVVAGSAWPVFRLAENYLQDGRLAAGYAVVYLLFPALQSAMVIDFRLNVLAAALLAWAWFAAQCGSGAGASRRWWLVLGACAAMAASFREEAALILAMMGLLLALERRRRWIGLGITGAAVAWLALLLYLITVGGRPSNFAQALPWVMGWGDNVGIIVGNVLTRPAHVLAVMVQPAKIAYIAHLFAPVGYLAFLAPLALAPAAPILVINLLASWFPFYSPFQHYSVAIAPFAVTAAAAGSVRLADFLGKHTKFSRRFWLYLCLGFATLLSVGYQMKLPLMPFSPFFYWPTVREHERLGAAIARQIPPQASVAAQNHLAPHVSQRWTVHILPYVGEADYIFLDLSRSPHVAPDGSDADHVKQIIQRSLEDSAYRRVIEQDGYVLLQRIERE